MATETPIPTFEQHSSVPSSAPPDRDEGAISLLDVLVTVVQRKWFVIKFTACVAVLALLVVFVLPVRYTANVVLLPPQQNTSLESQLASQLGSLGGMAALAAGGSSSLLKNPNDLYVGMFRSETVEDGLISKFGLMQEYHKRYLSDTRKVFERRSKVDAGKDGLIRISVEDHDPHRAADLANGYIDQFRKLSENLAITEAGQRRLFFQEQMEHAKDNLANAEVALTQTEEKTGLIQLDSQARALIESAASLRAQIAAKEVQIQGMETYATGENAQLIQARRELDELRTQLARLGGNQDIPGGGILPPKGQMTAAGLEYVRKLRDVKYYETIFDILARQFELAKLDEAKEGALIQVVDPAIVPDRKSSPRRALIVAISTILGVFMAVLTVLISDGLARMKQNEETNSKLKRLRAGLSFESRFEPSLGKSNHAEVHPRRNDNSSR